MKKSYAHVGQYIKEEYIDKTGYRRDHLSKELNIKYLTLHQIIHGSRKLSPVMGIRIAKYFNKPLDHFLKLQLDISIEEALKTEKKDKNEL